MADYYLGKTIVLNASFRTDGSSNFGSNRQFNPTWSAGAAWHLGEEEWVRKAIPNLSHATLRAAYGFTGDVNTSTSHLLVMQYLQQQYRYFGDETFNLGTTRPPRTRTSAGRRPKTRRWDWTSASGRTGSR